MDDNNEIEELEIGLEVDNSELKESIDEAKNIIRDGVKQIENVLKNANLGDSLADSLTKNIEQAVDKAVKNVSKNAGTIDIKANVTTENTKNTQTSKSSSGSGLDTASSVANVAAASNMAKASGNMKGASSNITKGADKIDGSGGKFESTGKALGTTTGKLDGINTSLGNTSNTLNESSTTLGGINKDLSSTGTSLAGTSSSLANMGTSLGDSSDKLGEANKQLGTTVSKIGTANSILEGSSTKIGNVFRGASEELGNSAAAIYSSSYLMQHSGTQMGQTFGKISTEFGAATGGLNDAAGQFESSGTDIYESGDLFVKSAVKFDDGVQDLINQSKEKLYEANLTQIQKILDSIASTMQAVLSGSKPLTERDYARNNNQLAEQKEAFNQVKADIDNGSASEAVKNFAETVESNLETTTEVATEVGDTLEEAREKLKQTATYITEEQSALLNNLYEGIPKGTPAKKFANPNYGGTEGDFNKIVGPVFDPAEDSQYKADNPAVIVDRETNAEGKSNNRSKVKGYWITENAPQKDLIDAKVKEYGNTKESIDAYNAKGLHDERLIPYAKYNAQVSQQPVTPPQPEVSETKSEVGPDGLTDAEREENKRLSDNVAKSHSAFKNPDNGKDTQDNQITTPNGITIVKRSKEIAQEKKERQDNYKNVNEAFKQVTENTPKLSKDDFPSEAKVAGGIEEGLTRDIAEKGFDKAIQDINDSFQNYLSDIDDTSRREQAAKDDRIKRSPSGMASEERGIEESSIMKNVPNLEGSTESAVALLKVLDEVNEKYGNTLSTIESGNLSEILNNQLEFAIDGIEGNGQNLSNSLETIAQDLGVNFRNSFEDIANEFDLDPSKMQQAYDTLKQSATSALESVKDSGKDLLDQPISEVNKLKDTIENPIEPKVNTEPIEQVTESAGELRETLNKPIQILADNNPALKTISDVNGKAQLLLKSHPALKGLRETIGGIGQEYYQLSNVDDRVFKQMANSAEDADDNVKSLKEQVEELNKVDTEKAEKEVNDIGKAAEGSKLKLGDLISELKGYVGAYLSFSAIQNGISAYTLQIESETKLATVMMERMSGVTEEVIQKFKDLTAAQQGLGVIGDEVQMSGMQQLSTFLTTTDALETLTPAMNNLLAQQKGLNASAQDAVSIGNLMGKVMQGQTGALTKAGITFSEAEEQVLKYGNEEERAAMLAQVITNNVGQMNATLANTPVGRIQQLKNNFGDLIEVVGSVFTNLFYPIIPILNTIISKVMTALNLVSTFIAEVFRIPSNIVSLGGASEIIDDVGSGLEDLGDVGGSGAGGAADGLDGVGDSAAGAAKEVEKLKGLMGFDEIQTIKTQQDPDSGGSGGGSGGSGGSGSGGAGGAGAGGNEIVKEKINPDEGGELTGWAKQIADALNAVWEALKEGWMSVSGYINQSIESLKAAFGKLGTAIVDFCVGAWNNGGRELFVAIGAFAGSVVGAVMDITARVVDAIANTINYLNPETNKFTAGFIDALTNAFTKVGDLVRELGGYFQTFLDNGGQAFLNVMGDIVMIVGTTFFNAIAIAADWVKKFFDSWAGQALLTAAAVSLDIIAGAIKAVAIVVEWLTPLWSALLIYVGTTKAWNTLTSVIGSAKDALTKLGEKVIDFGLDIASNIESAIVNVKNFGSNIKTHLGKGIKAFDDLGKKATKPLSKIGDKAKDAASSVAKFISKMLGKTAAEATDTTVTTANTVAQGANAAATSTATAATGAATVATTGLTLATTLLGIALAALGIGLVIAAIATLIAIIRNWDTIVQTVKDTFKKFFDALKEKFAWIEPKIDNFKKQFETAGEVIAFVWQWIKDAMAPVFDWFKEKFAWLGEACSWIGDQFSWAWGKIKGFFGFEDGENKISEETDQTEDDLNGLGDTMEEVSDRFGSACSDINESLASLNVDSNKLALSLDAAEQTFDEKFSKLSGDAQKYLDAIAEGNTEVLEEMKGDSGKYLEEIKYVYGDMTDEEKALFYATYDEIEGITDDWMNFTGLSYSEMALRHASYCESVLNNEKLSAQEKDALIAESTQNVEAEYQRQLAVIDESIREIENMEGISMAERNAALDQAYLERDNLINSHSQIELDAIDNTAEAQTKANEEMTNAADSTATAQEEALARVDTALETTKGNLQLFKDESDRIAGEIPKEWEGVGQTISDEFEGAIGDVEVNFDSILSNTKKQCDQLKSGIKKTFDEVKSGTKKSMLEVNATITDQFSKAVSAVNKAGNDLKSNLQTTLNNIASGIKKSFDSIKTNMTTSFTQAASSVQKALNECKSKISSTLTSVNSDVSSKTNSIKNNIENNFRNVKSSLTKPFEGVSGTIGKSLDGIKSTISTRLDSILSKIKSSVSSMKNAMDFTFPKPYLRLPHINVRGDWNFETKQVPKFSVQWYAKGGIMTNPTAFGMNGNNLMVGGEAGPEAILPLDTLFDKMNDMFDNQNRTIANTLANNTHNTGPVTLIMEMDGEKVAKGTVKNMQDLARIGALDMTWL